MKLEAESRRDGTLRALFQPESFVLIGASEKSTFARLLIDNLRTAGLGDRVHLVNPRSPRVFDQDTVPDCAAIGRDVDLAYILLPADRVVAALRDAAAAGVRAAVVLGSGFAEAGEEGRARQDELVAVAAELGVTVLGPNVLGYMNVVDGIPAMALSDPPQRAGSVALISQSGASCAAMRDFAALSGVDLSHLITVGNEAMVSIAQIADHLLDDERVRALAIFMESIKDPALFARVARRAALLGKPIVVLKAGRSELAARSAASHTGALVGDDRVVDAVLRDLGVIRVDTVEDLLVTAGIGARTGPIGSGGLAVVSISGGACDIVADLAEACDVTLPEFSPDTVERLRAALPAFGHAHNPLDITGAALGEPGLWRAAISAVADDPAVGAVAVINSLPWRDDGKAFYGQRFVDEIGDALADSPVPGLYVTQVAQPLSDAGRASLAAAGSPHPVLGLRALVVGFAGIARWSAALGLLRAEAGARGDATEAEAVKLDEASSGVLDEHRSREILESFGVAFVPAVLVADAAAAAAEISASAEERFAVKVVSPDIPHKSDAGGVALDVPRDAVGTAVDRVLAASRAAEPGARILGALVSPMRETGVELIVGVTRDDDWGLMVAVGMGGTLVEVLDDVVVAAAPVTAERARRMLDALRGRAVLDGVRGAAGVDIDALAALISRVSQAAVALGARLESLELNPVRAAADGVEALDALVQMRPER